MQYRQNERKCSLWLLGALLPVLTCCGTRSSGEQLTKQIKASRSWLETTQMISEAWYYGSVPAAYATRALQTAQEKVNEESGGLRSQSSASETANQVISQVQQIESTIAQVSNAVKRQDRSALWQGIEQLKIEEQALAFSLRERERPQP